MRWSSSFKTLVCSLAIGTMLFVFQLVLIGLTLGESFVHQRRKIPNYCNNYLDDCSGSSFNFQNRLICQEGKCDCKDTDFWNNGTLTCIHHNCQDRVSSAFVDPESGNCQLKLNAGNEISIGDLENNLVTCPTYAQFSSGQCTCDSRFALSRNKQKCFATKTYGEKCNDEEDSEQCDKYAGLRCDQNCTCRSGAIWDSRDSFCLSDEDCIERRDPESFFDEKAMECRLFVDKFTQCGVFDEYDGCAENSKCMDYVNNGELQTKCICLAGFIPAEDRKSCKPMKTYGESCDARIENSCSDHAKLICHENGICGCNDKEKKIWSKKNQRCVGLNKVDCYENEDCAIGSFCKNVWDGSPKCACLDGYTSASYGTQCLGTHLMQCENSSCQKNLACIDGVCECADPISQTYDKNRKTCLGLAGSPCEPPECIKNAECGPNKVCVCLSGFHPTPEKNCAQMLGYGENCTAGYCDFSKGLACKEETGTSTCSCIGKSNMTYVPEKGCVVPVGEKCGNLKPIRECNRDEEEKCEFYSVGCEENAECQHFEIGDSKCQHLSTLAPKINP